VILRQIVCDIPYDFLKIPFTNAHAMRGRMRIISAIILMALGVIWSLQGAGLIGGSFMSGEPVWLVIGIAVAATGLGLILRAGRS
jgi:hypothetical protein